MNDQSIYARAGSWLWDIAFPFWSDVGVDRENGGFVESLTLDGKDSGAEFKRTRVTCRQIYCFAQADAMGFSGAKEIVNHGLNHLTGPAWLGKEKGFAQKVGRDGSVIDDTPDLYDYAFVLFGLSWGFKATQNEELRTWAHLALDCTEVFLRDAEGLGFWHDATREGWRQQNPHMHLLEASLAAVDAFGDQRFKDIAQEIAVLFRDTFFDQENGVLPEFFDRNWNAATGADGQITEPGHQFEWAWILNNCKGLIGLDMSKVLRQLIQTGESRGINAQTGLTLNALDRQGNPLDARQRSWPNTERIKAACALYELDDVDPSHVFEQAGGGLLKYHLSHKPAGTWIDVFDEVAQPLSTSIPASTFYHVVLGFSEMLRIGQIRGEC